MDFLLSALRVIGILFLVLMVFNLMILVHEWGHFLAARWRGLKVEKFQIWFGKPIWKKTINGVQYGLGCLPLGGFVALPQMAPMDAIEGGSEDRGKLPPITPMDKIIVAFAGPLFSFLLACVFAVIVSIAGKPEQEGNITKEIGFVLPGSPAEKGGLQPGDKIISINGNPILGFRTPIDSVVWQIVASESDKLEFLVDRPGQGQKKFTVIAEKPAPDKDEPWWKGLFSRPPFRKAGISGRDTPVAQEVKPNSPAALAGIRKGDLITAVNGVTMFTGLDYIQYAEKHQDELFKIDLERDGKKIKVEAKPTMPRVFPKEWTQKDIGITNVASNRSIVYPGVWGQIQDSVLQMWQLISKVSKRNSDVGVSHMSSAIGIVHMYMNLFEDPEGWRLILWFSVVLNVNLAILNLLPLPILDGGHISMAILEAIRRRPLNDRLQAVMQGACVVLLLGLMGFLMLKDTGDWTGLGASKAKDAPKAEKAVPPIELEW